MRQEEDIDAAVNVVELGYLVLRCVYAAVLGVAFLRQRPSELWVDVISKDALDLIWGEVQQEHDRSQVCAGPPLQEPPKDWVGPLNKWVRQVRGCIAAEREKSHDVAVVGVLLESGSLEIV